MGAKFPERIRFKAWLPVHLPVSVTSPKSKGVYPKVWARSLCCSPSRRSGLFSSADGPFVLLSAVALDFRAVVTHPGCDNRAGVLTGQTTRRLA